MWPSCRVAIPAVAFQGGPHFLRLCPLQGSGPWWWCLFPCWCPQPAHPGQAGNCSQLGRAGLAGTAAVPERVGAGGAGEGSGGPQGRAGWWRGRGSALAPGGGPGCVLTRPCPTELSASDGSCTSDTSLLEEGEGTVGTREDPGMFPPFHPSCVSSIPTLPVPPPFQFLHCVSPPCH